MTKYKCQECGWIGTEDEMESDDLWDNWVCPKCKWWNVLNDYEIISEE